MIIPMRCMTCGNMIASKWLKYQELIAETKTTAKHNLVDNDVGDLENETAECNALNQLELNRYCCRRHILGHTDIIDLL